MTTLNDGSRAASKKRRLTPAEVAALLGEANPQDKALAAFLAKRKKTLRRNQRPPAGNWRNWLLLAGRGFGKSLALSHDAITYCARNPGVRYAVIAPTHSDCRKTVLEGASGIVTVCPPALLEGGSIAAGYNKSLLQVRFANGSLIEGHSAEVADRLRGPQYHRAGCDELAVWPRGVETWDMLQFCLRLGTDPRTVIATTPRPVPLVKQLLAREGKDTVLTRGSTMDNAANLAASAVEAMRERYEGTALGRQELHGELVEAIEGALWTSDRFSYWPDDTPLPPLREIVIAVDPSGVSTGDEAGIVAAGRDSDGRYHVLADMSRKASPEQWAQIAIEVYDELEADRIVVETNFGGDMAISLIESTARDLWRQGKRKSDHISVQKVTASRSKVLRAEPVAALYARPGRVYHESPMGELEAEMCRFTYAWNRTKDGSPGRVDALVFAISSLMDREPSTRPIIFGRTGQNPETDEGYIP